MRPANERRRYIVTSSLIGWVHTQNDPCSTNKYVVLVELSLDVIDNHKSVMFGSVDDFVPSSIRPFPEMLTKFYDATVFEISR